MSEILIAVVLAALIAVLAIMWFASPRTRRLAKLALIAIAVGAALIGLTVLVRVLWFPDPPV